MNRRARPPQGAFSIADLARREGISDKSARGRLRKYFGGTLRHLGISEWTYGPDDLQFVLGIINPNSSGLTSPSDHLASVPPSLIAKETAELLPSTINLSDERDPYLWPRKPRKELTLPMATGVYALFLREDSYLPDINPLEEGLIYIGLGSNLLKRCHFSGKTEGHSPRRSLAALLWHELALEPQLGVNGKYKLSKTSEKVLDDWMHENLLMAFSIFNDFEEVETALILDYAPPLNLTTCAQSEQHKVVKHLRRVMLEYAKAHH